MLFKWRVVVALLQVELTENAKQIVLLDNN